jgi:hypothetical protein
VALERFRLLQPHLESNEPLTSVAQSADHITLPMPDYCLQPP